MSGQACIGSPSFASPFVQRSLQTTQYFERRYIWPCYLILRWSFLGWVNFLYVLLCKIWASRDYSVILFFCNFLHVCYVPVFSTIYLLAFWWVSYWSICPAYFFLTRISVVSSSRFPSHSSSSQLFRGRLSNGHPPELSEKVRNSPVLTFTAVRWSSRLLKCPLSSLQSLGSYTYFQTFPILPCMLKLYPMRIYLNKISRGPLFLRA